MLKRIIGPALIGIVIFVVVIGAFVIAVILSPHGRLLLPVEHKDRFEHPQLVNFPGRLQARGNRIVTPAGNSIILKGLMPPDPARLDLRGLFGREFYERIHATGANVIRVAVHPDRWVEDPGYLWRHLDPIVGWAGEMDMYVIIDWHYIGNIESGAGSQMPDIEQPPGELTMDFWRLVSRYFKQAPNVIFEIWNEPAGGISATTWQRHAARIVEGIRSQGAGQLVIVGGVEYSRDLSWVLEMPIPDDNVAYAAHIYPAHSQGAWDYWFGEVSRKQPVVVTEWGFMDENRADGPAYLAGSRAGYAEPLLQYLDSHHIGWVACWYDDEWQPPMYASGWKTNTSYGEYVLEQLDLQIP